MNLFEGLEISQEIQENINGKVEKLIQDANAQANVNANKILDSVGTQIAEKHGVERLANETKITDYINRAVGLIGEKALNSAESVLSEKDKKIQELTATIEKSGDESLKSEFEKVKHLLDQSNGTITELNNTIESTKSDYENRLIEFKQNNYIQKSLPQLTEAHTKFGADFVSFKIEQAVKEIKAENKLLFDDNGKLVAENNENYTKTVIDNLLKEKLKDITDTKVTGGGAKSPEKNTALVIPDGITIAEKTQLVESHLLTKFKHKAESGYAEAFRELMYK